MVSVVLALGVVGCGSGSSSTDAQLAPPVPYTYRVPQQLNDGWQTAHLQDVGIDSNLLTDLINKIRHQVPGYHLIDSVLIVKDGMLVFDERTRTQFDRFDEIIDNHNLDLHIMNSVTKSFASTAVGIAIDQGYIPGIDAPVHDYFVDKMPIDNFTPEKQSITLVDWLTMRAGYQWDEWTIPYLDPNNQINRMSNSADPIQFLLDQPMATTPGTTFVYNSGVSHVIGSLLERATGQSVATYMNQTVFQPLNIQTFDYYTVGGQFFTGGGLYLTTRDMAKLGQLFLDGGEWNGVRVVSEAWVNEATATHVQFTTAPGGYGLHWWTGTFNYDGNVVSSFRAVGFGGQYVIVIPALRLVVAMTGHAFMASEGNLRNTVDVVQDYVLPSIRG